MVVRVPDEEQKIGLGWCQYCHLTGSAGVGMFSWWDSQNVEFEAVVLHLGGLMINDADGRRRRPASPRRQTPSLPTPMSAAHLYRCLDVGSDVTHQVQDQAVSDERPNILGRL
jgi:hypothetical protein